MMPDVDQRTPPTADDLEDGPAWDEGLYDSEWTEAELDGEDDDE